MRTIIVTDHPKKWNFLDNDIDIVAASDYLMDQKIANEKPLRVINLCKNYDYQSIGYYVSLLAEARRHKSLPSVMTIQDTKAVTSRAIINATIHDDIQQALESITTNKFILTVYFGKDMDRKFATLCSKLHGLFPLPLFQVHLAKKREWIIQKFSPLNIDDIPEDHFDFLQTSAKEYITKKRFYLARLKQYQYELAILIGDNDKTAPSCPTAIKKLVAAGNKIGLTVETIKKDDYKILSEYDALFIRETTAVNHHSYKFSRRAHAEGMIVIDDPKSILKCTNKVYLAEILSKNKIPIPETTILNKQHRQAQLRHQNFPCVLKRPDGAFSQGLVKVESQEELESAAMSFFQDSELIILQSFLPSEYDWRIGVIDHKPIFACRYFMVEDHWQVYQWDSGQFKDGKHESVPIAEVPDIVIQTALRATALIGNSLYGVDLKEINGKAYVIEVNDNPNIDYEVEDQVSGDQLYIDIMNVFLQRLHKRSENGSS